MTTLLETPPTVIGVGIDTARYGHRVTFLRADKQPAASPLDVLESHAGYQRLQKRLEQLAKRHPGATFHVRLDAAGQYAVNLEGFLRGLPLPLEISLGEPARNAAYRRAHFPKQKTDASDSFAQARYAVVERPAAMPATPPEFLALREVAGQLESQVKQTSRLKNQLHNLLARVFPELATIASDVGVRWVLQLLTRYPTPQRLARAKPTGLATIAYLKSEKAAALQHAAQRSVGSLGGDIAATLVREAVREIEVSQGIEDRLERLLQQAFDALPEGAHRLLTTIPGIGPATAAALVAKVVSLDRFATPDQLVSYFGVFPENNTSGYDRRGRPVAPGTQQMSRQGNDLVRRNLWMAAQTATLHNPAIRALYGRQRARGKRGDVALGHCMRKLLHLVFAVWKTGRPFDPRHYPWESAADRRPRNETAAGHKPDAIRETKVVTAAASSVAPPAAAVQPAEATRPPLDFAALRGQVTMQQVLDRLGWLTCLKGGGLQRRGPCPLHGQRDDGHHSFSVHLGRHLFRCFHPECSAQGNVLDLWAAVHRLPLYEAAVHLAETFNLPFPEKDQAQRRGTRTVSPPRLPAQPSQQGTAALARPAGVTTPDAP